MYLNKAQVAGNLTRDPELKALPSGSQVVSFSVATNRKWTDKNGEKQEQTEFHNCTAFGKTAETIAKYFSKGKPIYVEGRLQTRSWEKDGVKHYRTEVVVDTFQFMGDRTDAPKKEDPAVDMSGEDVIDDSSIPF